MKREGSVIDPRHVTRLSDAADWLLRLQAPEHTEADYQDWLRWCDADPQNFAAFEAMQSKWRDLDALKSNVALEMLSDGEGRAEGRSRTSDDFDLHLTPAQKSALLAGEIRRLRAHQFAFPVRRSLAIAAGIAAAVALAVGLLQHSPAWRGGQSQSQEVAAQFINRSATLPDGSTMILGAQSAVNMDFNGPKRQLDLSSGAAYFKVKHDRARPFVVRAGEISVTAVGTAFDVRRVRDEVTVTVEEGTVEVRADLSSAEAAYPGENATSIWRAEAGYQLTYSTKQHTASLASVNPSTALAWRNGELAYIHEPLASVVEDLNRYSTRKIVIADPEVGAIPFTGTAFASSLNGWLAGVEQAYPVVIEESPTGDIVLRARK